MSITIDVELTAGLLLPVTITVNGFWGKLHVKLPRPENWKHFNVSFASDPGISFDLDWKLVKGNSEYNFVLEKLNSKISFFLIFFFLFCKIIF